MKNSLLRFSTDEWPEYQRLTNWRELYRTMANVEITPLDDDPYHAETTIRLLPGLAVAWGTISRQRVDSTRELLVEGDDDLHLMLPKVGDATLEQAGRELSPSSVGAALWCGARPGSISCGRGYSYINLKLPRRELEGRVFNLDRLVMQPLGEDVAALAMLRSYVGMLVSQPLATTELQALFVAHVRDLVALTLGARSDAAELARGRGLRAARLQAARNHILEHLGSPDLSVTSVAARQKITPRYLQMLFDAEGTTFSEFVLKQRLAYAHRALTDPRLVARPIGVIALDAGFGDLSYFSRVFRRQYGSTPSDLRAGTRPKEV